MNPTTAVCQPHSDTRLFYISYFKLVICFWREEVLIVFLGVLDLVIEKSRGEPLYMDRTRIHRLGAPQIAEQEHTVKWPHILTVIAAAESKSPGYGLSTLHTICDPCHVRCQLCMLATSLFL